MERARKQQALFAKAIVNADLPKIREIVQQSKARYGEESVRRLLNEHLGDSGSASLDYTIRHARPNLVYDACLFFLENGADMDSLNSDGCTPLHSAACKATNAGSEHADAWFALTKLLVELGAAVNLEDLFHPVQMGNTSLVRLLLSSGNLIFKKESATVNRMLLDRATPCNRFKSIETELLQMLVDAGFVFDLDATDHQDATALFKVCLDCYDYDSPKLLEKISFLIDNGANPNSSNRDDRMTPLHAACSRNAYHLGEEWARIANEGSNQPSGHPGSVETCDVLQLLVDKGADIHARNSGGDSVIFHAIMQNPCEDPNIESEDYPFRRQQKEKVVRWLLAHGADLRMTDGEGETPLMWLAGAADHSTDFSNSKTMELILGEKWPCPIEVNTVNPRGLSALHIACLQGKSNMVKLLLQNDQTDINLQNTMGATPLMLASKDEWVETPWSQEATFARFHLDDEGRYVSCLERLLNAKNKQLDINSTNCHGKTALHFAAHNAGAPITVLDYEGYTKSARLGIYHLLSTGAKTTIVDKKGNTPLITAASSTKYYSDLQHLEVIFTIMRHQLGEQGSSMFQRRSITRKLDNTARDPAIQKAPKRPRRSEMKPTILRRPPFNSKEPFYLPIVEVGDAKIFCISDKALLYKFLDGTSFLAKKPTRHYCKSCLDSSKKLGPCGLHTLDQDFEEDLTPPQKALLLELRQGAATTPAKEETENGHNRSDPELSAVDSGGAKKEASATAHVAESLADVGALGQIGQDNDGTNAMSSQGTKEDGIELDDETKLMIERMAADEAEHDFQAPVGEPEITAATTLTSEASAFFLDNIQDFLAPGPDRLECATRPDALVGITAADLPSMSEENTGKAIAPGTTDVHDSLAEEAWDQF